MIPTKKQIEEKFDKRFLEEFMERRDDISILSVKSHIFNQIIIPLLEGVRAEFAEYTEKQLKLYDGKLPFVVWEGKADEKEKITIYEQAMKDTAEILSTLLSDLKE